mgnify:FL=1
MAQYVNSKSAIMQMIRKNSSPLFVFIAGKDDTISVQVVKKDVLWRLNDSRNGEYYLSVQPNAMYLYMN